MKWVNNLRERISQIESFNELSFHCMFSYIGNDEWKLDVYNFVGVINQLLIIKRFLFKNWRAKFVIRGKKTVL